MQKLNVRVLFLYLYPINLHLKFSDHAKTIRYRIYRSVSYTLYRNITTRFCIDTSGSFQVGETGCYKNRNDKQI